MGAILTITFMLLAWTAGDGVPAPTASAPSGVAVPAAPDGSGAADALARPSEAFEKGRIAFGRAQYQEAIAILGPLLYPDSRLETEGEVVQAHRMLGVAHVFEHQPDAARHEFRKLLELRPDYRFDPLLDPPPVVELFNEVLRGQQQELASLQARRDREQSARRARERVCAVERRMVQHSRLVALLPFGTGQFQNGETRKGVYFLGVEAALAATSVGALVANFAMFGVRPQRRCLVQVAPDSACPPESIDRTDENLSRNIMRVQVVSGGLFFAVAAWGAIDALLHLQPLVPAPAEDSPPREPTRASLRFAPLLSGSTAGAGLSLSY